VIGANPTVNHPVAATFIKNAAKRGAKLIVIDPRGQSLSRHAYKNLAFKGRQRRRDAECDDQHHHHRGPHRRTIYRRLYRRLRRSQGAHRRIHARENGADLRHCRETIREVARLYARSRASIIFWGMGISQHVHGTDNARCLIALALITGQVGRPGTGLHPLRGQNNVQGASDAG